MNQTIDQKSIPQRDYCNAPEMQEVIIKYGINHPTSIYYVDLHKFVSRLYSKKNSASDEFKPISISAKYECKYSLDSFGKGAANNICETFKPFVHEENGIEYVCLLKVIFHCLPMQCSAKRPIIAEIQNAFGVIDARWREGMICTSVPKIRIIPGYLYLLSLYVDDIPYIKFGRSCNIQNRLDRYTKKKDYSEVILHKTVEIIDNVVEAEEALFSFMRKREYVPDKGFEWFLMTQLTVDKAIELLDLFMKSYKKDESLADED